jgi:hypothetical protein
MYLRCRDNSPWAGPKCATGDYSRLSCGVGDTQLGPMPGSQQASLRGSCSSNCIAEIARMAAIFCRAKVTGMRPLPRHREVRLRSATGLTACIASRVRERAVAVAVGRVPAGLFGLACVSGEDRQPGFDATEVRLAPPTRGFLCATQSQCRHAVRQRSHKAVTERNFWCSRAQQWFAHGTRVRFAFELHPVVTTVKPARGEGHAATDSTRCAPRDQETGIRPCCNGQHAMRSKGPRDRHQRDNQDVLSIAAA